MITLKGENLQYAEALLQQSPKEIQRAAASAINRTVSMVRTKTSKTIRENYTIKSQSVKGSMETERATAAKLHGVIRSKGRPPLLTAFDFRRRKRGAIRVRVLKKGTLKPVGGLFVGTSRKGYTGAMQRIRRKKRYPLRIPYGPSIPQMFGSERVLQDITPFAEKTLNKRFLHEIDYRFARLMGGKK